MRTQALLGPILESPLRERDADHARSAPPVRPVCLTPSTAWRASHRISWTRGTLRRWRGPAHNHNRQTASDRGVYAGLSNTKFPRPF